MGMPVAEAPSGSGTVLVLHRIFMVTVTRTELLSPTYSGGQ